VLKSSTHHAVRHAKTNLASVANDFVHALDNSGAKIVVLAKEVAKLKEDVYSWRSYASQKRCANRGHSLNLHWRSRKSANWTRREVVNAAKKLT
jgi:hypothetical protein